MWTRSSVLFGETCFFKPTKGTATDEPRCGETPMKKGICVVHHERTGASLMLTPEGMARGTAINRLQVGDLHEHEFLSTSARLTVGR